MRLARTGFASLAAAFLLPISSTASPYEAREEDPCAKIAGKPFVAPADARACLNYFPFNETLRQNVLDVVSKVFDFYTFEDYYLAPVPEFGQPAVNIREELARIERSTYEVCHHGRSTFRSAYITALDRLCFQQRRLQPGQQSQRWSHRVVYVLLLGRLREPPPRTRGLP